MESQEVQTEHNEVYAEPVEVEQAAPETSENSAPEPGISQEEGQERNWRNIRQQMKDKDEETRRLRQEMEEMRQELRSQSKPQAPKEEEQWLTDTERRLAGELKEVKSRLQKNESDLVTDRLKMRYPDFENVVNAETITQLKRDNPSLAKAIASMQGDHYDQAVAAYEILKRSGYTQDGQEMYDKAKIEKNQKKPVSVQAVRKEGPLGEANRFALGLTPELKKQLNREMAEASKRS